MGQNARFFFWDFAKQGARRFCKSMNAAQVWRLAPGSCRTPSLTNRCLLTRLSIGIPRGNPMSGVHIAFLNVPVVWEGPGWIAIVSASRHAQVCMSVTLAGGMGVLTIDLTWRVVSARNQVSRVKTRLRHCLKQTTRCTGTRDILAIERLLCVWFEVTQPIAATGIEGQITALHMGTLNLVVLQHGDVPAESQPCASNFIRHRLRTECTARQETIHSRTV